MKSSRFVFLAIITIFIFSNITSCKKEPPISQFYGVWEGTYSNGKNSDKRWQLNIFKNEDQSGIKGTYRWSLLFGRMVDRGWVNTIVYDRKDTIIVEFEDGDDSQERDTAIITPKDDSTLYVSFNPHFPQKMDYTFTVNRKGNSIIAKNKEKDELKKIDKELNSDYYGNSIYGYWEFYGDIKSMLLYIARNPENGAYGSYTYLHDTVDFGLIYLLNAGKDSATFMVAEGYRRDFSFSTFNVEMLSDSTMLFTASEKGFHGLPDSMVMKKNIRN